MEKAVVVRTAELQKAIEELQQSENQIKTIFEAAPDGVIAIDHHGIIINWNTEAENIFGWEKHEVLGKPFAEMVISKSYREQLKRTIMKLLKMGGADAVNKPIEMKGLRKDKTEIPVELKISVSQINHVNPIFIGFARNIADRKFSESQLKNKAAQIAEKVIELQRANKELEAFTYVSSHDLQEPLRKIQTFAGRILEGEHQHLSEKGKDMFRRMQEAGQRMQALIQDLLAFSRVNSTERIFEKANLNEIIEQVKREFKEIIEEKKATIEVSEMCKANIIRFQFRQLMQNLISNSLKFSRSDTPPRIIIKDEMAKGIELNHPKLIAEKDYCHITFMDNGIGFEPEFSEKVFEVFQKLHTRDEFAGTGIGLAIVKKIVENHEGIITATSELTKGTKFDIYIPA
ncbi:MAG TPA: PAS domain S-box protein [Saprospiraceae bacterium]